MKRKKKKIPKRIFKRSPDIFVGASILKAGNIMLPA